MSRTRSIKPGFFKNDILAECEPLARILFIGLWTIADREGRLEDRPKKIKAELLPYDDCDADLLLSQLEKYGFILRYEIENNKYIQILKFTKHQNCHVKEGESIIPAPDKHDTNTVQAPDKHDTKTPFYPLPSTSYLLPITSYPLPSTSHPLPQSAIPEKSLEGVKNQNHENFNEVEKITETTENLKTLEIKPYTPESEIGQEFLIFWADYPENGRNKGSQQEALKKFKSARKQESFEKILTGVRNYAGYLANTGQKNADAFRWLEKERWRENYSFTTVIQPTSGQSESNRNIDIGLNLFLAQNSQQQGH